MSFIFTIKTVASFGTVEVRNALRKSIASAVSLPIATLCSAQFGIKAPQVVLIYYWSIFSSDTLLRLRHRVTTHSCKHILNCLYRLCSPTTQKLLSSALWSCETKHCSTPLCSIRSLHSHHLRFDVYNLRSHLPHRVVSTVWLNLLTILYVHVNSGTIAGRFTSWRDLMKKTISCREPQPTQYSSLFHILHHLQRCRGSPTPQRVCKFSTSLCAGSQLPSSAKGWKDLINVTVSCFPLQITIVLTPNPIHAACTNSCKQIKIQQFLIFISPPV